jgi:hypothetical protein
VCAGGPPGWRSADATGQADPAGFCAAECCAWADCNSFVVAPHSGGVAGNCTAATRTCCFLKAGCEDRTPSACKGCTAAFVRGAAPPGPPEPRDAFASGYFVSVDAAVRTLALLRLEGGGAPTPLAAPVDLGQRQNGLVLGAWALVRVLAATRPDGGLALSVWWSPMFLDTGFAGQPEDVSREPLPIAPLIAAVDPAPLPSGGAALVAGGDVLRVDYFSALPTGVFA